MRSIKQSCVSALSIIGTGLLFCPIHGFGVGHIIVYTSDSSATGSPPPATEVHLNDAITQPMETNEWVVFNNLATGIHTVKVATASNGYLLRESPSDPTAVNNPDSPYGNPRHVQVLENEPVYPAFLFDPVVTVSAVVRDGWTMERLEDAALEFVYEGATGSVAVCRYPWTASYATNWLTDSEGSFPTNTILYLDDYDLNIYRPGYETFTSNGVIGGASAGNTINLGTLFLYPTDENTNQMADAWETLYFGAGSTVDAQMDADGDGMSNRDEYLAGTDPTNGYSCLWLEAIVGTNELELAWYTEPDRTYCISGTTNLCTNAWVQVGGPWEATNGQLEMVWTETNLDLSWNTSYRVEVVPCGWMETNTVLINTNTPYSGGSGTNTWPGGPPPLPE